MAASGSCAEYDEAGGRIMGKGFAGSGMISGDQMCFACGFDPASCWTARIEGDRVTWFDAGVGEGTGTIRNGNPAGSDGVTHGRRQGTARGQRRPISASAWASEAGNASSRARPFGRSRGASSCSK